jgi:hypothetical protein
MMRSVEIFKNCWTAIIASSQIAKCDVAAFVQEELDK